MCCRGKFGQKPGQEPREGGWMGTDTGEALDALRRTDKRRTLVREPERGARFERFCRMRLQGRNDLVYRAYDLLDEHRGRVQATSLMHKIRYADIPCQPSEEFEVYKMLQKRFSDWGFGIVSFPQIETLIKEFFIYHRIAYLGWTWPYRDPDDAARLMVEQEKHDGRKYSHSRNLG